MSNIIEFKPVRNRHDRSRDLSTNPTDENEIRFFWRMTRELREAMAAGDVSAVRECLDELDVLALNTENPNLRRMCQAYQLAA